MEDINARYDQLANRVGSRTLVELRLARSLWAMRIAEHLVMHSSPPRTAAELRDVVHQLRKLRTLITDAQVQRLVNLQNFCGNAASTLELSLLMCAHTQHETASGYTDTLGFSEEMLRRLGPARIKKFRPIRKRGKFDPNAWLTDPAMSQVEFIDGDPDRVRIRGIELHSGDIGIVELNEPGDPDIDQLCAQGINASSVKREHWYCDE